MSGPEYDAAGPDPAAMGLGEADFRSAVDVVPVMIRAFDADRRLVYHNSRWPEFIGRDVSQPAGQGWHGAVHAEDAMQWVDAYDTNAPARRPFAVEYRLLRHDGVYRHVVERFTPRALNGAFDGYVSACFDETESRDLERTLLETRRNSRLGEELYRALAETIPALVLTTSAAGEVQYCNARLLEYCGTDIKGLQGTRWVDYIHPGDVREGRELFERQIRDAEPFHSEYRIRRHDGLYRWHLTHTAPLRTATGEIQAWVAVSVDVHDRREAEQKIRDVAIQLQRANASKDEFLGLVSHELRTPINTIYGNAQVLRRLAGRLDEAAVGQAMDDIEQEALRLQQLVDNMFVLARIEAGAGFDTEPVLLGRLVARVVDAHRTRHPGRDIVIDDHAGAVPVRGEPLYVEQALRNLLANAEKYSPPHNSVRISIDRSHRHVAVRVLDRGIGIAADEIGHVFDTFYRTPRASGFATGAGIGLAVARRLVEAQGGEIWIQPREGGGTEAGFTLPLEAEEDA